MPLGDSVNHLVSEVGRHDLVSEGLLLAFVRSFDIEGLLVFVEGILELVLHVVCRGHEKRTFLFMLACLLATSSAT